MHRDECYQKIYGGCAGDECDRECITARIIDLDARIAEAKMETSGGFWSLATALLIAAVLMWGALSMASIIVERNKDYRSANADV